jgi:hypothetical protein
MHARGPDDARTFGGNGFCNWLDRVLAVNKNTVAENGKASVRKAGHAVRDVKLA